MKKYTAVLLIALLANAQALIAEDLVDTPEQTKSEEPAVTEEQAAALQEALYLEQAQKQWEALKHQQGEIKLPNGVATLHVPDNFYYLDPADSETVLVDMWGNLPGAGSETLGMLVPANTAPYEDDSWGVTVEYENDGNVSDEDADAIDYDDLLADMQSETREESKQRVAQGYEAIELIGWAAKPYYDKDTHKLHWAKELRFGDDPMHTLNYNIRALGREGVLVLNFIAGMDQKAMIEANLNSVLGMAEFNPGSRYEDFNPDLDKVAAYGIGALVAGKVAAKAGLFAAALIFLKKFGILILVGLGALGKKLFGRKTA